jgi:hypothetical protein
MASQFENFVNTELPKRLSIDVPSTGNLEPNMIVTTTGLGLGVQLVAGVAGVTGLGGVTGPSGGSQGNTGLSGPTGIQGVTGYGVDGTTGVQGIQGATGFGIRGFTGTIGQTGVQGATGVQGIQGQTGVGAQGATGVQGLQGQTGVGAKGATGVQGITGIMGNTGSGLQGITGLQGATGAGLRGMTGIQGNQGNTGVGAQGDTGVHGFTGLQGQTGIGDQGVTGIQGPRGFTGAGIQGDTGLQGRQGNTGIRGETGVIGFTGAQGMTGSGLQGETGIQGVTGVGARGSIGTQGMTGISGTQITTWLQSHHYYVDECVFIYDLIFKCIGEHTSLDKFEDRLEYWVCLSQGSYIASAPGSFLQQGSPVYQVDATTWAYASALNQNTLATHIVLYGSDDYFIAAEFGTYYISGISTATQPGIYYTTPNSGSGPYISLNYDLNTFTYVNILFEITADDHLIVLVNQPAYKAASITQVNGDAEYFIASMDCAFGSTTWYEIFTAESPYDTFFIYGAIIGELPTNITGTIRVSFDDDTTPTSYEVDYYGQTNNTAIGGNFCPPVIGDAISTFPSYFTATIHAINITSTTGEITVRTKMSYTNNVDYEFNYKWRASAATPTKIKIYSSDHIRGSLKIYGRRIWK